jgi:hypothetical protein
MATSGCEVIDELIEIVWAYEPATSDVDGRESLFIEEALHAPAADP